MKAFLTVMLAGAVAALTIAIRIPIPGTGGYLNFGDIAVIFCGLFLGKKWGAVAGGVGSALADILGGFFIFAPITLVAKGLEGLIAGILGQSKLRVITLPLAGLTMLTIYFIAETLLPGMGLGAALSELPFNLIQAFVGVYGGLLVFYLVNKAFIEKKGKKEKAS
ncbi:MAG: hypothetical protein DRP84_05370 [Spirochaetes bacterium]|nr:MAG: hypothetical protein DRP84_05370 [Spirochaetota bacterium]RKX99865.1 MAG: hypothetical protein DRP55_06605 [Spirochaetota bacterium]